MFDSTSLGDRWRVVWGGVWRPGETARAALVPALAMAACVAVAQPAPSLQAPQPYVIATDGVTRLTLEEAGILNPDGRAWAVLLGKALFWDQQVGSDGQSCASCHFNAGADARTTNTFSPGFLRVPTEDTSFGGLKNLEGEVLPYAAQALAGKTKSGGNPSDATYELKPADFPLYELSDYKDRNSPINFVTDDAVSSQGSYESVFTRVMRKLAIRDRCSAASADIFHAGAYAARQVEPRNTPTTINAVFNLFNFWDGRANRQFNGVGVFGPRDVAGDKKKRLVVTDGSGNPVMTALKVNNASLASQAVGPPLSEKEMSCDGRVFADLGRKMLLRRPLALQKVHAQDSVLGVPNAVGNVDLRDASGRGLKTQYRYDALIKKAFDKKYWNQSGRFVINDSGQLRRGPLLGYTQMEHNFSMFWGLAIQLYEATLVSDKSRFDSCNPGGGGFTGLPVGCRDQSVFTPSELNGFRLFNAFANTPHPVTGAARPAGPACNACHVIPLTSEAQFQQGQNLVVVERSRIDNRGPGTAALIEGAVHDRGFFNIGVTPTSFDPGNGGTDIYGNPLSMARMFVSEQGGTAVVDPTGIGNVCNTPTLIEAGGTPLYPGCTVTGTPPVLGGSLASGFDWSQERQMVDGGFKTPTLRNVGLTAPYFHNGTYATLRQVVEFYNRGGSRRDKSLVNPAASPPLTGDTTGTGPLGKSPIPVQGSGHGTNVDRFVQPLNLTEQEIDDLTAFMLTMTDDRVQCDKAPFDHPSLFIPVKPLKKDANKDGRADDQLFELAEAGALGYYGTQAGLCIANRGDLFAPSMQARSSGPTN